MYAVILAFSKIKNDDVVNSKFHTDQFFDAYFDFNFPIRPLLEFVAECLRQEGVAVEISLPDYLEWEDFMTGYLTVDGREVSIYFEHSLSHLSLSSFSQEDLMMLINTSQGKLFQHKGYDLENAQLG